MAEPNNNDNPIVFSPAEVINDPKGCAERVASEKGITLDEATKLVEEFRDRIMQHHTRNVAESTGGGIPSEERLTGSFSADDRLSLAEIQTFHMNEKAMTERATFAFNMLARAHKDGMQLDPSVMNAANAILVNYLGPNS